MPGSSPATSQLDWLSSTTAMIVLSWSKATRDLLKACPGEGRGRSAGASGHSISWLQRRWCHLLAACPIPSLSAGGNRIRRQKIYADTEIATDREPSGRVNNTDRVFALREGHVAPAAGSRRDVGRPLRLSADCTGNAARRHCHENRVGSQRRIG